MEHEVISKGLEIWTLQTLLDVSILMGLFALGLILIRPYYESLKNHLTLRVSIEIWDLFTVLLADVFLVLTVLIGFLVLNPDIMADIKMAVPFVPLAVLLFAVAMVLRLFYDGHRPNGRHFKSALWLMFAANLLNIIGFSLIMEAPGSEYLQDHPSVFWTFIKTHFRSNALPHGLELAQWTFYIVFPLLLIVFIWGFFRAMQTFTGRKA